ncbi:MAG: response regulator [Lachnospiraceae bacterium]|nr:response regulator [Lachnospiraceae bacterium]
MKLLIVDDEIGALRDLTRVVKKVIPDEEILTSKNSKNALEICKEKPLDVIFLDINMPDIDGLTLAKKIKTIQPGINIIMVTAYPDYALDAFKLYVSDYILKPADPEHVKRALAHLRNPIRQTNKGLYVQCFGNFEVFYDGEPVHFGRAKVKELFAYLIDRRGASATNAQLRAILWMDDATNNENQRKYFARIVHDLQVCLDKLGLSDIFLHSRNSYAIVPDKIPCDYYQALEKDPLVMSKYQGEYMFQYEWTNL